MYVGVLSLILGQAVWFESAHVIEYALAFVLMHAFVIFYEESALKRKFGESYKLYCETVPRWIPRVKASNELKGDV
jgi:protein-S-isoprenylcysteine O-methyltransferase Ste14